MHFDVKITTQKTLMEIICPHYCLSCGKLGEILCGECKNHNILRRKNKCLKCGIVINDACPRCSLPYSKSWVAGTRDSVLGELIRRYKYKSVRASVWPLAEILNEALPSWLPEDVVVVPVPTNTAHIRMRGLDHTWLLARKLSMMRGWRCERVVKRVKNTVQVGAGKEKRWTQAESAYELTKKNCSEKNYLVVDDVATTGASVEMVARTLVSGGAKNVMVAVIAKNKD